MVSNEKLLEQFSNVIKEVSDKFRKSNVKAVLIAVMEVIRQIIKGFDKSPILDECNQLMEKYRIQIEKVKNHAKKVKNGDRQCIEVIKQKKDIDELIMSINKEKLVIEHSLSELQKINSQDFQINLGDSDL